MLTEFWHICYFPQGNVTYVSPGESKKHEKEKKCEKKISLKSKKFQAFFKGSNQFLYKCLLAMDWLERTKGFVKTMTCLD